MPETPLFNQIQIPADLKRLDRAQLPALADELRRVIMDTVAVTGGHLGSGMGVVELTIALHYLFDFKDDRLVFDVGHQAYPHKLLTGRKDRILTLRQKGGLSGFTNRFESEYDVYTMGHAGTAASCAIGIAAGDQLLGKNRRVVSVTGDASMGAGVAFEALNYAGTQPKCRTLMILNDNSWSIAKTVGALSRYLDRVRAGHIYNQAKSTLHQVFKSIPVIGKDIDETFDHAIDQVRKLVVPGAVFEELGLHYFGPIDGHDFDQLLDYLERTKDLEGPVLLHVRTKKGHGVPGSQERYDRAHAAKPAPKPASRPKTNEPTLHPAQGQESEVSGKVKAAQAPPAKRRSWTEWFAEGVDELAQKDPKVMALTAAMPDGTGLMGFAEKYPERFVDAGIAEQHAIAMASGLATAGCKPIAAIYSTFLQRGFDQIFQEVALQELPVVFALDRAGIVGEDGATHNGIFDIAFLRSFPGITLMAPKDGQELKEMLALGIDLNNCSAIRFARGAAPSPGTLPGFAGQSAPLVHGKMEILRQGADGAILAYGHMVETALLAAQLLEQQGLKIEVVNARFCKPLDVEGVLGLCDRHDKVVTLEDHAVVGGFGSAVLEAVAMHGPVRAQLQLKGIPDRFLEHASRDEIMAEIGLDAQGVAACFLSQKGARVS